MNTPNKLTIIACAMHGLSEGKTLWASLDDASKAPWMALAERIIQTTFGAELGRVDRAKLAATLEKDVAALLKDINANTVVNVSFNVMSLL